jgi:hypothetical protein
MRHLVIIRVTGVRCPISGEEGVGDIVAKGLAVLIAATPEAQTSSHSNIVLLA